MQAAVTGETQANDSWDYKKTGRGGKTQEGDGREEQTDS